MNSASIDQDIFYRDNCTYMEKDILSRTNLESMSTQDLLSLADEYGIEIPDNLNRRFIIGELLEAAEEFEQSTTDEDSLMAEGDGYIPDNLPESYNETSIDLLLRNPAWIFTFWDLNEADKNKLKCNPDFNNLFLHVGFFKTFEDDEKTTDCFDVKIDFQSNQQYILIPSGKKIVRINLAADIQNEPPLILASTKKIEIPCESEVIQQYIPGKKQDFPELVKLSGIKDILHDHYINHRESFSN